MPDWRDDVDAMHDEPTVTITVKEYESLKDDADTLRKLENAGVDNWEWYGEALNSPEDFV